MIKENIRIKENITFIDVVNVTNTILEWIFEDNNYEPWYKEPAKIFAICTYFIDGLEIEKNDAILDIYNDDKEVKELVDAFLYEDYDRISCFEVMEKVNEYVEKKEKFNCDLLVHSIRNYDLDKIVKACDVIIDSFENFSKMNLSELTAEDIGIATKFFKEAIDNNMNEEDMVRIIKDSIGVDWSDTANRVIESKNEEIRVLKEQVEQQK